MLALLLGLLLFIGVHSVRIFAEAWRTASIARYGLGAWKVAVSVLSIIGLVLMIHGYGVTRLAPEVIWTPPVAMRHLGALLTLIAFILVVAAYVPRNAMKVRLRHPMVLGVKLWALAHLLANGTLADILLFGSLLVWAVFSFRAARQRDRLAGAAAPNVAVSGVATISTIVAGILLWAIFAFWAHAAWIGVNPFGA